MSLSTEGNLTGQGLPYQRYLVFLKASCLSLPTLFSPAQWPWHDPGLGPQLSVQEWGCPLLAARVGTDSLGEQSLKGQREGPSPEAPHTHAASSATLTAVLRCFPRLRHYWIQPQMAAYKEEVKFPRAESHDC